MHVGNEKCIKIYSENRTRIGYNPEVDRKVQDAAERTPLFEKQINSKPKKIRKCFFYIWKERRMPFYINVF